jgi:hypothetical protein
MADSASSLKILVVCQRNTSDCTNGVAKEWKQINVELSDLQCLS